MLTSTLMFVPGLFVEDASTELHPVQKYLSGFATYFMLSTSSGMFHHA